MTSSFATPVAAAGGEVLAAVFGTLARLRDDRPLHPQGASYAGTVTTTGHGNSGVPWLDQPAHHEVTVRVSRALGLPRWTPDIYGIALRARVAGDRPADLLFASTGDSVGGRLLFRPRRALGTGPLTTLLPVRSPNGALVLRLTAMTPEPEEGLTPPRTMALAHAHGTGAWRHCGELLIGAPLERRVEVERHDPVLNPLPGTEQYPAVRALREPSYRSARAVPVVESSEATITTADAGSGGRAAVRQRRR
jgi:hypothetical protein